MDAVREWAIALCAAAVLCAAAGMISPGQRSGKGMRVLTAAVMLCAVVLPLARMDVCSADNYRIDGEFCPDSRLCAAVERQTADAMSRAVCELVGAQLEQMGVEAEDIEAVMDISDDGCITIGKVRVIAARQDNIDSAVITDTLFSRLGLKAEVIIAEVSQ